MWMLWTELRFSATVAKALHCWTSSLAPCLDHFKSRFVFKILISFLQPSFLTLRTVLSSLHEMWRKLWHSQRPGPGPEQDGFPLLEWPPAAETYITCWNRGSCSGSVFCVNKHGWDLFLESNCNGTFQRTDIENCFSFFLWGSLLFWFWQPGFYYHVALPGLSKIDSVDPVNVRLVMFAYIVLFLFHILLSLHHE